MTIGVTYDLDRDVYSLVAITDNMGNTPAGPRLFRAPPYPDVRFEHGNAADAKSDAALLQTYVDVAHARPEKKRR